MLTPQDIRDKQFVKAVFGGYDMATVDDFLEELTEDYAALYKENAILKSKIKVLVEKVEEYRATEDAMRMALLTAQKMGDDLVTEAQKQRSNMLASVEEEGEVRRQQILDQTADETARLENAKAATNAYVEQTRQIAGMILQLCDRMAEGSAVAAPAPAEVPAAEQPAAVQEEIPAEPAAPAEELPAEPAAETDAEPAAEQGDEEFVTPRPKFDFENLQFGSNLNQE